MFIVVIVIDDVLPGCLESGLIVSSGCREAHILQGLNTDQANVNMAHFSLIQVTLPDVVG